MKNLIKTLSLFCLALMVAVPAVQGSTVDDAHAAIANLRALTEVLPVTKAKDEAKIHADLNKKLDQASALLNAGGIQNYYKAARSIYEYSNKVSQLINSSKVSYDEGVILFNMGVNTIDCIVVLYCPECIYP